MAKTFQFRRYSSAALAIITPADGEIIINKDTHQPVIGDGETAGGIPIAGGGGGGTDTVIRSSSPLNVVTPAATGQFCVVTGTPPALWVSTGMTSANWTQLT
jgi:hypothetical protein